MMTGSQKEVKEIFLIFQYNFDSSQRTPLWFYFGAKLTGFSFAQNLFIRFSEILPDVFHSRVNKSDRFGLFKKIFITAQVEVFLPIRLHPDFFWENFGKYFFNCL